MIEPEKMFWENVALGHDAEVVSFNSANCLILLKQSYRAKQLRKTFRRYMITLVYLIAFVNTH